MTFTHTPAILCGPAILFCPADRPDRYQKAAERSDAVILDLEDAVAPEDKPAARTAAAHYLAGLNTGDAAKTIIRINRSEQKISKPTLLRWLNPDPRP